MAEKGDLVFLQFSFGKLDNDKALIAGKVLTKPVV